MTILKTTAALSLAVLISFGASGCTSPSSSEPATPSPAASSSTTPEGSAPANNTSGTVRDEAQKTLNEIHTISKTPEYAAFMKTLESPTDGSVDGAAIDKLITDNKPLIERIDKVISFDEKTEKAYKEGATKEGSPKLSDATIAALTDITVFSILAQTSDERVTSYGLTSDAVTEANGVSTLNNDEIYLKDKNSGIITFGDVLYAKITLEDGGKKLVLSEPEAGSETAVLGHDASAFADYKKAFETNKPSDTKAFVDFLNGDGFKSDATFEVTNKDGAKYVKVVDPGSKISEGEILFTTPAVPES